MARKAALTDVSTRGVTSATRASAVYEQMRWDLAHGVLEPGARLRVEAMSARYDVGASPIREALSRLSAEGLVDRTDLRGFSVATLNWDELPVLTRTRVQLESLALRESIAHRDQAMEPRQRSEWWFGLRAVLNGLWVMSGLLATIAVQNQIGFATLALVTGVIVAPVVTAVATR